MSAPRSLIELVCFMQPSVPGFLKAKCTAGVPVSLVQMQRSDGDRHRLMILLRVRSTVQAASDANTASPENSEVARENPQERTATGGCTICSNSYV